MKEVSNKKIFFVITLMFLVAAVPKVILAEVASSTNYQIQVDSVNSGGTDFSTSTNYKLSDTVGEIATGIGTSTNFEIYAGYRQMESASISLADTGNINLGSISGITESTATGSTTLTVITDSPSGYELKVKAGSSPALTSGAYSFTDYTPTGGADFTFTINASDSEFGFTPEGTDITSTYQDDGGSCGSGSSDAYLSCWDGFSTSDKTIANSASSNHPLGITTDLVVRAKNGSSHLQEAGSYSATITVTAVVL